MFLAIIFLSAVFLIVSNGTSINTRDVEDFQKYLNNYVYEAGIVINNAVYHNSNISLDLREYTENFISYMKNKDTDIGVVFIYTYDNKMFIDNYLNDPVLISSLGLTINPGEEIYYTYQEKVSLKYRNETFTYQFSDSEGTEFKTLFVKEN